MEYIVYGKTSCTYCEAAKNLLASKGEEFTYKQIGVDTTKEELIEVCQKFNVVPRTVPQIFCDNGNVINYVGGYDALQNFIKHKV